MKGSNVGRRFIVHAALIAALVAGGARAVQAQEGEAINAGKRWSNEAQLSYVRASGNTSAVTLAVADRFTFNWAYSELVAFGEIFRTTTTERSLFNEGGTVREELIDRVASERYELGAKFRRNVLGNVFWFVGGGWYRNRPAGVDARLSGNGGIGYRFVEDDASLLVGEIGVGITRETALSGLEDTFADGRAALELRRRITTTAEISAAGELIQNLQNTADRRMNLRAALTAAVSGSLAMRFGWDIKHDAEPPVLLVDTVPGEAPVPFTVGTTDHTFSASLVVSF